MYHFAGKKANLAMFGHCVSSTLSTNQFFVIDEDYIGLHDSNFNFEKKGPKLNFPRKYCGCSSFYSSRHDNREILIVIGGWVGGNRWANNKIELWDFTQPQSEWEHRTMEIEMSVVPSLLRFQDNTRVWIAHGTKIYKTDGYTVTDSNLRLDFETSYSSAISIPINPSAAIKLCL